MEKRNKPKEQIYISNKILGQLYSRVETIDFMPQYEAPFDSRILDACPPDETLLNTARQVKSEYDTAVRRIMAQQEIRTEFEVWTTFVLSRPRVGSDYKVQEDMAHITGSLKDRFKQICIEKAGGAEMNQLAPFVAAMYKVTWEELEVALRECRTIINVGGMDVPQRKMEPKSMPLISFPWLFNHILGRIATGSHAREATSLLELAMPSEPQKFPVVMTGTAQPEPAGCTERPEGAPRLEEALEVFIRAGADPVEDTVERPQTQSPGKTEEPSHEDKPCGETSGAGLGDGGGEAEEPVRDEAGTTAGEENLIMMLEDESPFDRLQRVTES